MMTRNLPLVAALLIFLAPSAKAEPIILCGDDTVFVVDTAQDTIEKVWTWKAKQCEQLPEAMRSTFTTTDDCKPVDGGSQVLVSSSSGGHDLQPVPRGNDLVVITGPRVYFFDRDKHEFRLHPDLGQKASVKSVSVHPVTGRTAFIQASDIAVGAV